MSKTIRKSVGEAAMRFVRKFVVPVSVAFAMVVPNFTYAFETETNEWKNVQIYGGGMITGIQFSEAEENLIYARTDMGGVYRWQEDTQSWKPLTDFVGPDEWSNLGCDAIATDPSDPNRVYFLMGEYDNGWTDVPAAVFCSDDKGESFYISELPFFAGSNLHGRLMGNRIAVDPNNSAVLYLGSRNDGLWKSEDYGKTWNQVESFPNIGTYKYEAGTEWEGNLGIISVLFDENSGKAGEGSQTIYVGVADRDHSMYRSKDGGKTWEPMPNEPRGKIVNEETGEWKMEDDVTLLPYQNYLTRDGIMYVTYSTSSSPYAGDYYGDVWKCDTKTDEWTLISPKSSKNAPNDPYYGYCGLAVDAQDENCLTVISQAWWPDAVMFRSTDGGETWKQSWEWTSYPSRKLAFKMDISDAPWLDWGKSNSTEYTAEIFPKFGWCVGAIGQDPFNSDRLMYGTGATLYGTDNLTKWDEDEQFDITVMADGIEEINSNHLVVPTEGAELLSSMYDLNGFYHEDVTKVPEILTNVSSSPYDTLNSSVWIDYAANKPNMVVRVGERLTCDSYGSYLNGLMVSKDYGKTFSPIHSRIGQSNGKGSVAIDADGGVIVWATPDEPVSWAVGGYNWKACEGIPMGAEVASDRVNPNKFYGYCDGKFYVSTDGAKTFVESPATNLPKTSTSEVSFKVSVGHEGEIWLSARDLKGTDPENGGLWYSSDSGMSFTKIADVDSATNVGLGKGPEGSENVSVYIVGRVEGKNGFFRSNDLGESWVRINDDNHQYGLVDPGCDMTGDPNRYGRVYIGTNGRGIVYADTGADTPVVESATITPAAAEFDKYAPENVNVTMTLNGNVLDGLKVNGKALVAGTDYTVNGNTVAISKDYLAALDNGKVKVTFDFSAGYDKTLTITVKDTTPEEAPEPTVEPEITPVPTVEPTVTPEPTVEPTVTPVPTVEPSTTPVPTVEPTVTPAPTVEPTVEPTIAPDGDLKLTVETTGSTLTNTLSNSFKFTTVGDKTYDMSKVEIRYYYNSDNAADQSVWVDNAAIQYQRDPWYVSVTDKVNAQIVKLANPTATADCYLSLSFNNTDTIDKLATATIATRTAKSDWSQYDQSNDYSFGDTNKVVVLYDGVVISGVLPQ